MKGFKLITLVVIDNDCIDSCKSYYHTIMTTTAPAFFELSTEMPYPSLRKSGSTHTYTSISASAQIEN